MLGALWGALACSGRCGQRILGLLTLGSEPALDARVTLEAEARVVLGERGLVLAQKVESAPLCEACLGKRGLQPQARIRIMRCLREQLHREQRAGALVIVLRQIGCFSQ